MQNEKSWKTENKGVGIMQPIPSAFFPCFFFRLSFQKRTGEKASKKKN